MTNDACNLITSRLKQALLELLPILEQSGYLTPEAAQATISSLPAIQTGRVAAFAYTSILHEASLTAHEKVMTELNRIQNPLTIQSSLDIVLSASFVLNMLAFSLNNLLAQEDTESFPVRRPGCELEDGFDLQRLKDFAKMLDKKAAEGVKAVQRLESQKVAFLKAVGRNKDGAEKLAMEMLSGQIPLEVEVNVPK